MIVLLGATGYTGKLIAHALTKRGLRPVLAGRNKDKLAELASSLGDLDVAVADSDDFASVRSLVERGDVLITTVGPFSRLGSSAVQAAVDAGAHYFDTTGAGQWVREVFENYGPLAAAQNCGLLPAFGFESVPGNLAAALALSDTNGTARSAQVMYVPPAVGQTTAGTRKSAIEVALEPGFAFRSGRLLTERLGSRVRLLRREEHRSAAISIPSSEHLILPRSHPGLRDVGVYLAGFPAPAARMIQSGTVITELLRRSAATSRVTEATLGLLLRGTPDGPAAAERDRNRSLILGRALDANNRVVGAADLRGGDPYEMTAALLAWATEEATTWGVRAAGALGPVEAFGLDRMREGAVAAGLELACGR